MDKNLFEEIKKWRDKKAREEGLPSYRILQNKTIEDIIEAMPESKKDLLSIKGIKERKFEKYGKDILSLVANEEISDFVEKDEDKPYTVSGYLDLVNYKLRECQARVQGEISSLKDKNGHIYFSIKDKEDESVLDCIIWASNYKMCGIELEEGMEIIVQGHPDVYKPYGRMSFKAATVELVGEGALKKAYQKLKKKLENEGLFDLERKRKIPDFPHNIGVITSETGAVIHDFLNNLGKYGYRIKFFDSRVEGQAAIKDLLSGIKYFKKQNIDVLVIIRGGGSLESLQAFNNELLVREIADFKNPVICGIGHDKDIPLASLAADLMVSTPTAVTTALNRSWDEAVSNIKIFEKDIIYKYKEALSDKKREIEIMTQKLKEKSELIFQKFKALKNKFLNKLSEIIFIAKEKRKELNKSLKYFASSVKNIFEEANEYLKRSLDKIKSVNPENQLKLGYSIVSKGKKIIKSVNNIKKNEEINIMVSDGEIKSQVNKIINK